MEKLNALKELFDPSGIASNYISSFGKLTPNDKVFLLKRVSGCERRQNLKDQDANLRELVDPVGDYEFIGSGFNPRRWVNEAAKKAKLIGANCSVENLCFIPRYGVVFGGKAPKCCGTIEVLY